VDALIYSTLSALTRRRPLKKARRGPMDAVSATIVSPRVMFEETETENIALIARPERYTMEEAIKTPPKKGALANLSIKATRIVAPPESSSRTTDTVRSHVKAQGGSVEQPLRHGGPLYNSGINGTVNIKTPPTKANQRATISRLLELPGLAWLSLEETAPASCSKAKAP